MPEGQTLIFTALLELRLSAKPPPDLYQFAGRWFYQKTPLIRTPAIRRALHELVKRRTAPQIAFAQSETVKQIQERGTMLSCLPAMWQARWLAILWILGFAAYYLLMEGSLLGLQQVTTDGWGGLSPR